MNQQQERYVQACEAALAQMTDELFCEGSIVSEAAVYSLMNGGKRVRGVLTLAVCEMLCGDIQPALPFACAIEMVHAFSLIHDDLPCMDDASLRRGKPACHIAYGERTALLAGDLLALQAFEAAARAPIEPAGVVQGVCQLAQAAGAKGMIYGQELDLDAEQKRLDLPGLERVHRHKTGALIAAAMNLGVLAAGRQPQEHPAILQYAQNIGLVFQIVDDVLDATASVQQMGKPVGNDEAHHKNTYAGLLGIDASQQKAAELTAQAIALVDEKYGESSAFLQWYAQALQQRLF